MVQWFCRLGMEVFKIIGEKIVQELSLGKEIARWQIHSEIML